MRLLAIFGPPAVGKMTVGRAVVERSTFRMLHNHAIIEPLIDVFGYGTPPFNRLLREWRVRITEEAAGAGIDLLLTFVWGLNLQSDLEEISEYVRPYVERGADVVFVELAAGLDTRLRRNRTELRLAEKRSKRDVEWSDANVREMERHVMNTGTRTDLPGALLLARHPHLRIETDDLDAQETAGRILTWLDGLTAGDTGC